MQDHRLTIRMFAVPQFEIPEEFVQFLVEESRPAAVPVGVLFLVPLHMFWPPHFDTDAQKLFGTWRLTGIWITVDHLDSAGCGESNWEFRRATQRWTSTQLHHCCSLCSQCVLC